jgi:nitrous oxide reductase accessory protein NosL
MKNLIIATFLTIAGLSYGKNLEQNSTKEIKKINQFDPVYQLPLVKFPKFSTELILKDGRKFQFVSVKAMMHFYFHPERYPSFGVKSREEVENLYVKDYISGEVVDAKKAWYVFGSRLVGPHGDDLIPFASKASAELFMKKYGGSRLMQIDKFTFGLIKYLDM